MVLLLLFLGCTPSVAAQTAPADSGNTGSFQHLDKVKHVTTSFVITTTAGYYLATYTQRHPKPVIGISVSVSLAFGFGKELRDWRHPGGTASWGDILADLAGVAVGGVFLGNMLN